MKSKTRIIYPVYKLLLIKPKYCQTIAIKSYIQGCTLKRFHLYLYIHYSSLLPLFPTMSSISFLQDLREFLLFLVTIRLHSFTLFIALLTSPYQFKKFSLLQMFCLSSIVLCLIFSFLFRSIPVILQLYSALPFLSLIILFIIEFCAPQNNTDVF